MLADTSVLHRVGRSPEIASIVSRLRSEGRLWTCDIVTLELGYSARHQREWLAIRAVQSRLRQAPDSHLHTRRAIDVQGRLAEIGHHRVAIPDLLIAAAAEAADVPVLHYDGDYDLIASVTGQDVAWVVERGTID